MRKRFVGLSISFLFLVNLVFIFSQAWKIIQVDRSEIQVRADAGKNLRHDANFPLEDDIERINNAHLFGQYAETKKSVERSIRFKVGAQELTEDIIRLAPEARLSGEITGLLLSDNDKKNLVIIERSGKQLSYSIGERIAGSSVVILRILQDKILLNENGYYASMLFNE